MGSGGGGRIKLRDFGLVWFGLVCLVFGWVGVGVSVFFRRFRRVYNFHGCGRGTWAVQVSCLCISGSSVCNC